MQTVNKNFVIYRWAEIVLLVIGAVIAVLYKNNRDKQFWFGLGLALSIQAAIMLTADYFAAKKVHDYTEGIRSHTKK